MPELPTGNGQEETSVQSIPVPPTPQAPKSSNEILCELFGAFNATPPPLDDLTPQDSQSAASERSHKRHKKHSKKKSKKLKKKRRSSSSDSKSSHDVKKKQSSKKHKKESGKQSISESESVDSKKKKKKRKLGKFSASDTDSDEDEPKSKKKKSDKEDKPSRHNKVKIKQEKEEDKSTKLKDSKSTTSTGVNSVEENILKQNVSKILDTVIDSTNLATERSISINTVKIESNVVSEEISQLPLPIKEEPKNDAAVEKISKDVDERQDPTKINMPGIDKPGKLPVADVFAEDLIDCGIKKDEFKTTPEKSKPTTKKIMIQNLKFSQVYEATVKQIEEEAKLKAEKYEEGELSESTAEEERSPTPSEVSSSGSVEEVELETPSEEKKRHRHHHKKQSHRHCNRRRSSSKEKHRSHSHRERSPSQQSQTCRHRRQRKSRDRGNRHRERSREQDSKDKIRNKDRDRSKDKGRSRDRERSKEREKARNKSKDRARGEKHRHGHGSRSRSREREKRSPDEKIDKQKLLEIARKNALNMMKNPSGAPEQTKLAITSGGKTVNELTDFCKLLSKKDADGHESISSNTSHSSDSESEKPFHHPFQIKDRPSSIVLNIRVSPPHC